MPRKVSLLGKKELEAELAKLVADIAGKGQKAGLALKEVLRDAAEPIRAQAVINAPKVEGDLKAAIFATRGDASKSSAIVGVDHKRAPHATLVEFGHAGPKPAPPHPYMRPAVEANRARVRSIIEAGIGKIVSKYT
jgi:HK97 gp10 family phage protein